MTNPWHRLPPRLRKAAVIITVAIVAVFGLDLATVIGFSVAHPAVPDKVDAVIVLGAKVGTPALKYRTLTGLSYYQAGKTGTIVLSGARGANEPISEAQAMNAVIQDQLAKTHQKRPHIILETKSTDTYQNLRNSRALIPDAKSVVVVSDGYHLARSVGFARHVGFQKVYWDAPKPSYYGDIDLVHYYVREAVAVIVYLPQLV